MRVIVFRIYFILIKKHNFKALKTERIANKKTIKYNINRNKIKFNIL